ncbi:MAG: YraN family protein [Pseudomonadota bacterium]
MNKGPAGEQWETIAGNALRQQGLKIRERNFSCRLGEIDIIAESRDTLVFVEVRYRTHRAFGDAATSVTLHKRQRIIRAAKFYLANNPSLANRLMRFDVIAFDGVEAATHKPRARWIKAAFDASGAI